MSDLNALSRELQKEKSRRTLAEFTMFTDQGYQMNWHHKLLCEQLDKLVKKQITRLMVFMPPRHGKSELVSRKLPAFIFGTNPDAKIMACCYSADLARRMNRDVQRIMDSERYQELFGQAILSGGRTTTGPKALRGSDLFELVGRQGVYRCAGVGGGITGMGGDYIIIDDPVKNREDANSSIKRDKVWDWYTSTLYTRQEKDACILLTMTRWHEDDLAGRLLNQMKDNQDAEQWVVLSLPAICEQEKAAYDIRKEGEPLWQGKFDRKKLLRIKSTIGTYDWSALYMQRPQPVCGSIFKREWLGHYYKKPPELTMTIQSWDLPFKKSAASAKCAGLVMGRRGAQIYILDVINEKMEFTESVAAIKSLTLKYPKARGKVIEDKANGPAIINLLHKEVPGMVGFSPKGSKVDRALSVTPYFEAGNILLPHPDTAPWVGDLVEDLINFPGGKYKDTVDALVQGIIYLMDKPKISSPNAAAQLVRDSYWG